MRTSRCHKQLGEMTSRSRTDSDLEWSRSRDLLTWGMGNLSAAGLIRPDLSSNSLSDPIATNSRWASSPMSIMEPHNSGYPTPSPVLNGNYNLSYPPYPPRVPSTRLSAIPPIVSGHGYHLTAMAQSQPQFQATGSGIYTRPPLSPRFTGSPTTTAATTAGIATPGGAPGRTMMRHMPIIGTTVTDNQPGSYYGEHRRLFGYKPSLSVMPTVTSRSKGKGPKSAKATQPSRLTIWKKEVMCLRCKDAKKVPDTVEKIALGKIGLTVKEVKFDLDGDLWHFDSMVKGAFPELYFTGGYTLMRPSGSKNLAVIDPPKGGFNVRYIKDILQNARLYIRPLQNNIDDDLLKQADGEECEQQKVKLYADMHACML